MEDSIEDYIRISRNQRQESPRRISQELLVTAQRKKDCEARAMKIVEFSIDGKLRPEVFIRCLPHINKEHYQDIVEERAITKLCGYPICGKRIPELPNKQYHISTARNQVYDITDRRNYCSNHCYKASIHIKEQVDSSPLWLRKPGENTNFKLLAKSEGGLIGELIDQGIAKPTPEPGFTSVSTFTEMSLDAMEFDEIKPKEEEKKQQATTLDVIEEDNEQEEEEIVEKSKESIIKCKKLKKKSNSKNIEVESQLRKSFKEWITLETLIFIHGEEKIKSILNHEKLCQYFEQLKISEQQLDNQKRYMELCKKLHLMHLADEKFDKAVFDGNLTKLKPLPDYKTLKEESKTLDVKVKSFYSGVLFSDENKNFPTTTEQKQDEEEKEAMVLPLVEAQATVAMRRKVFLNALSRPLQALLVDLRINQSLVVPNAQSLVKTFKLSAHNVSFKPVAWKYIVIIIIKILMLKDEELRGMVEEVKEMFYLPLNALPDKGKFINDILEIVLDVDSFVKNFISQ